ncbi:MAG: phage head closure protein [Gemmobacter sp.]
MTAGLLRERVTVERAVRSDDGYGNVVVGWADLLSVWADVRETPGKERLEAGRIEASATATIRIRSSAAARGVTEADRIRARGAVWNIRSIVPVGNDGAMMDILCESGVAA